ncbi:MAG: hypothetical protein WBA76_14435 [Phormidesmis sp.]
MTKQSLTAVSQQQLVHQEALEHDRLNSLLGRLEQQKQKLPTEYHAIIDWGIGVVKAKIQEEKKFKREMDEAWKQKIGAKLIMSVFDGMSEGFDPENFEDKRRLYIRSKDLFLKILELSVEEGYVREPRIETSVNSVKRCLYDFCQDQGAEDLYIEMIRECRLTFSDYPPDGEFIEYYEKIISLLD